MNDWNLPWSGGCRCGQIRLRVSAPPLLTMACHCTGCQRMTASAFSLSVAIPSIGFSILKGQPTIGGLHGATRHYFCPHCMSWMFTRPEGMDEFVNLRATMLDDVSWFTPFIETWTREKLLWATTSPVYSFETLPKEEDYASLIEEYAKQASKPKSINSKD
ncbi:MAG TPA: GFA family protein [Nodularia sp. (in: cyanobacteria)]|nr:GFA family protein [Nodularia sp. (in: cyanobacteria)]